MNKILSLVALSLMTTTAFAQKDINYNYLEFGYDYVDISGSNHLDGFYLDAGFDLTDRIYMGAYYSNLSSHGPDIDRYGLSVGFHSNTGSDTDFYAEFDLGQIDNRFGDSLTYGLNFGTRTAFTSSFELITKAGYTEIDDYNDGYFEAGIKGLFKFSSSTAITAGVQSLDGDLGANVGFRFSF